MTRTRMASWTGTTPYATKKQLVSSINGLYSDLEDFQFSTITSVSTLTVKNWLSVPTLYVSDIQGYNFDISGIVYADAISSQIGNFSFTAVSTIQFVVNPSLTVNFNAKEALFGALSGLGFLIFETLLGIGGGTGLALKGLGEGIAAMIMARGTNNYINNTQFELLNGATQLQVSTLGNAYPLYSSVTRYVSSISPNQVGGSEIFLSTFFNPGTTCIRSISDPYSIPSSDSNIATSSIQMFGEWVALEGLEPDNIVAKTLALSNVSQDPLFTLFRNPGSNPTIAMINSDQFITTSNNFPFPYTPTAYSNFTSKVFSHRDEYITTQRFISTPYYVFQSTIQADVGIVFITSNVSTPSLYTYSNDMFIGDFAVCEPDETGFRSTATMDFIVNGTQDLLIQWGFAADNRNSTIGAGTGKRVTWNNVLNTSNFTDIPQAQSTIVNEATQQIFEFLTTPYEIQVNTGLTSQPSQIAFNVIGATFGSNTTLNNQSNYPYQFNGNTFINGVLEAQTIIATSSIFATSTFVDTQISTQSIIADTADILEAYIDTGVFREMTTKEGYISTLKASSNYTNDYITSLSRHRFAGYQTPISIITGKGTNLYDTSARFDFNTDSFPQAVYLESQPANNTLMYIFSTNIEIPNLTVNNLTANNIVYSNADVPNLQTSTISFGWTGDFSFATPPLYSLSQTLSTEPGLVYNTYAAASNQVLNIMNFSNSVTMLAQQFSTPLTLAQTTFNAANIQGWASTIFYNGGLAPAGRVNLASNSGMGELSLQGQTNPILVSLNTLGDVGGVGVTVPVGSTYKFTSGGAGWTTLSNAPTPGIVQYNNNLNLSLDFENTNLTTTDTLNINAEKINLNGIVSMQNSQFSNIFVNTFVSTSQLTMPRAYTGAIADQGTTTPINITNTVNSADFPNIRATINPNRGFNAFNSVNFNEWNNSMYNIDVTAASGTPVMVLGDLIIKSPPTTYAGQFFINNAIDSPGSNIPLYVNVNGLLSSIGNAPTNQYTRVFTSNGSLWSFQSNVPNPSGLGGYTYPNFYTMTMNSLQTVVQVGQPLIELTPSRTMTAAKIILDSPSVRVNTIGSPSFPSKESGFEYSTYFDENVVFTGSQSDAVNAIVNSLNNYYYSVAGWSAQIWISRMRTESLGIQGFDIDPIVQLISGTNGDYIWASARYINVNGPAGSVAANIRENYFMTPKNYHTSFTWLGQ